MTMHATITLKEGYRLKFFGEHVLVAYEISPAGDYGDPYLILLASIKPGEEIPRATDEAMRWDI